MGGENKRQFLHISMCLFGILFLWIPYWMGLVLAGAAFFFNLLFLRWIAPDVYRGEPGKGGTRGILIYPAMVFLLIIR
jgi:hypothetical protein